MTARDSTNGSCACAASNAALEAQTYTIRAENRSQTKRDISVQEGSADISRSHFVRNMALDTKVTM